MNTKIILNYLADLSVNNNREWYHEHKKENKAANAEFEILVQELICGIGKFDPSVLHNIPKELTFKLVRGSATINRLITHHSGLTSLQWANFQFLLAITL